MPRPDNAMMPHRAVLWRKAGADESGNTVLSAPEEIRLRWNKKRTEALQPDGTRISVDATVRTRVDLVVGDQLWLAPDPALDALEQWYGTGSGGHDNEVMEVVGFNWTSDVKGRNVERLSGLNKYQSQPA